MAEPTTEKLDAAAPVVDAQSAAVEGTKAAETTAVEDGTAAKTADDATKADADRAAATEKSENEDKPTESATEKPADGETKTAAEGGDAETKDAADAPAAPADDEAAPASASADTPSAKSKGRRKSGAGEGRGKTLSRKASKVKLTHIDAKPGDHFLVKLKGHPAWPVIICDESMLPQALVNNRPVAAARPDGTFTEAYADGGKKVNDRSFPVMFLYTNEFSWRPNMSLIKLVPNEAEDLVTDKMRKDLKEAYFLAAENNPIEHYKDILNKFQEEQIAQEKAQLEAAATPKKKKGKAKAVVDDEDVDMLDADEEQEKPKSSKKRKAEDAVSTPQRSDSVKKPKIKLNTSTPKASNGTPKAKDDSVKAKVKAKKVTEKKSETPKEPKMTPEERHERKQKEVLYLRHKLQKGLLTRDQQPQEAEMKQMSDYITMLENFNDLDLAIMRATKINKVFKGILKLEAIPREEEFKFKERSRSLLEKWNKLIANDASAATNGVNGKSEGKADEKKAEANGVKDEQPQANDDAEKPAADAETKDEPAEPAAKKEADQTADESVAPPEPVEATA